MEHVFSKAMQPLTGSAIREIFKLLASPDIISLAGGNPSPFTFDEQAMSRLASQALEKDGKRILQYGATEGYPPLIDAIIEKLAKSGIKADRPNIQVLSGSSQGIELCAKVFLNAGDVILVENPTFLGALQTFRTYGAEPVGVDCDSDGVIIDDLREKFMKYHPKLLYLIPNFQNPSGNTMSLKRREKTLELCREFGVLIMEDDPYGELRYSGEPLPSMKSMDDAQVILLNSFSKTVSPGLRVGFSVADAAITRKLTIGKQGMDTCSGNLQQAMIAEYLNSGEYYPHVERSIEFYRKQRDAMADVLKRNMSGCRFEIPDGGLFFWIECERLNATKAFEKAVQRNVAYVPGTHFYAQGGHDDTLRLNFSMADCGKIEKGVAVLGKLFKELDA